MDDDVAASIRERILLEQILKDDILAPVREQILKEDGSRLPWAPKSLDRTWEVQAGFAGAFAGMVGGALFGMHMGLAGPWGAIAGTIPCAIVGGILGYLSGAKAGSMVQRSPHPTHEPTGRASISPGGGIPPGSNVIAGGDFLLIRAADACPASGAQSVQPSSSGTARAQAALCCIAGPCVGATIVLKVGTVHIGRSPDSDIPLADDSTVSWQHAVIERTAVGWEVRDLGSTNGTRVNGVVVRQALLHPGDTLAFGRSLFRFDA